MKTMKTIMLSVIFLIAGACNLNAQSQKESKEKKIAEVTFNVSMECESCKAKIERNIPWEKGVKDLKVDLAHKTVSVVYDPRKTNEEKLKKAFENLEFTCKKVETARKS